MSNVSGQRLSSVANFRAIQPCIRIGPPNACAKWLVVGQVKVATAELSISVQEFYERFFADNAPFGLPDFHMSRGDWEVSARSTLCQGGPTYFLPKPYRPLVGWCEHLDLVNR